MDEEDLEPRARTPQKLLLDPMSIEELEDYIAELQAEIGRVEKHLKVKKEYLDGLDGLFKK